MINGEVRCDTAIAELSGLNSTPRTVPGTGVDGLLNKPPNPLFHEYTIKLGQELTPKAMAFELVPADDVALRSLELSIMRHPPERHRPDHSP